MGIVYGVTKTTPGSPLGREGKPAGLPEKRKLMSQIAAMFPMGSVRGSVDGLDAHLKCVQLQ